MTTTHHATRHTTRHTTRHDTTHHEMPLWMLAHHLRVVAEKYGDNAVLTDTEGMPTALGDHFRMLCVQARTWARVLEELSYGEDAEEYVRVLGKSLYVWEHKDEEGESL